MSQFVEMGILLKATWDIKSTCPRSQQLDVNVQLQ